ncbi:protein-methionine-sulfoxide reductase heme-binding subunit MsrQ [Aliiglaciecola sp. 2_MG-2023]|uniref:protein-methionine-sulfoxide reductase heme-binding subunit MsrQ n=1 Tax=unclassified Aliiglaciecola TaxID=2593648 RepID=UPI0026E26F23|nr:MULTISPECIES: protein-methionine-sulfoxide reductase heme-binding subunit MsrQ [unclassified Aliiglaciecola]MDO6710488.1 protein-methionine-sulfoxide reductase heme-binding subunit MsrQ [Aliiglaciecola sp. 2_MG-2023]MDO6751647.1 protein-methionine-sulfoxide reductase heme-binding subunit MsrQ [Aliiglaciecola sp. 1_MG-2023]
MKLKLTNRRIFWLKVAIHLAALVPLIWVFYQGFIDQLGGDPVKELLHFTGISAFNLLLISLLVSPLAKRFRIAALIRVRRLIGLYAFVYALTHFLSYILFELQLAWQLVISEIIKRPYITVGFIAFVILLLLTMTSTTWAQRKLGKTWQTLHNFVYIAAILIAFHYIWSVKSDILQPLIYWALLLLLLFFRKQKFIQLIKKCKKTLA